MTSCSRAIWRRGKPHSRSSTRIFNADCVSIVHVFIQDFEYQYIARCCSFRLSFLVRVTQGTEEGASCGRSVHVRSQREGLRARDYAWNIGGLPVQLASRNCRAARSALQSSLWTYCRFQRFAPSCRTTSGPYCKNNILLYLTQKM